MDYDEDPDVFCRNCAELAELCKERKQTIARLTEEVAEYGRRWAGWLNTSDPMRERDEARARIAELEQQLHIHGFETEARKLRIAELEAEAEEFRTSYRGGG